MVIQDAHLLKEKIHMIYCNMVIHTIIVQKHTPQNRFYACGQIINILDHTLEQSPFQSPKED